RQLFTCRRQRGHGQRVYRLEPAGSAETSLRSGHSSNHGDQRHSGHHHQQHRRKHHHSREQFRDHTDRRHSFPRQHAQHSFRLFFHGHEQHRRHGFLP